MSKKIEDLKEEYRKHLREGRERDATEAYKKIQELRSEDEESQVEDNVEVSKDSSFESIDGVGDELAALLSDKYDSVDDLADADVEDLEPISGIGSKRAKSIIEQAGE